MGKKRARKKRVDASARKVRQFELDDESWAALQDMCQRTDRKQKGVMSRVIRWFVNQSAEQQEEILRYQGGPDGR
jgi:predicted transcriptional regulator